MAIVVVLVCLATSSPLVAPCISFQSMLSDNRHEVGFPPGLDTPSKTHGVDSLVPARPKAAPGLPWQIAL